MSICFVAIIAHLFLYSKPYCLVYLYYMPIICRYYVQVNKIISNIDCSFIFFLQFYDYFFYGPKTYSVSLCVPMPEADA